MPDRPAPDFVIRDILVEGSAAALISAPGVGKTFVALDMAMHIAAGYKWLEHEVKQMPVAYILAEGTGGIGKRVHAWRQHHQIAKGAKVGVGLWFWDKDIQLATDAGRRQLDGAMTQLEALIGARPGLVVIDTLARCFTGDENSVEAMSLFVGGVDVLRALGCTVLILHHTGHKKGRERGSTALRGAVDTMLFLESEAGAKLLLSCQKQRDAEHFDPVEMRMRSVELPSGETSCVIEDVPDSMRIMPPRWMAAVKKLGKFDGGATLADWMPETGLSRRVFFRMKKAAIDAGIIRELDGGKFGLVPKVEPETKEEEKPNGESEGEGEK